MDTRDGRNSNESFADQPRSLDDFTLLKRIGGGNTADALLAETVLDGQYCVVRAVRKKSIFGEDEAARVFAQKEILSRPQVLEHPFIITLQSTFQNKSHLFFVTEFVAGGDLMFHLREGRFELSRTRFYAAEVCLALQFLHSQSILHRGVSLDNILLTSNGHIELVGFSHSKLLTRPRTRSFVGSATFVAPEVLLGHDYGFSVDWWAFGVVLYQMLFQREPFSGDSEDEVLTAILDRVPDFPSDLPSHAETLLRGLFESDPDQRFWAQDVREQPFFANLNWDAIQRQELTPPFVPNITAPDDTSNFDVEWTVSGLPVLSVDENAEGESNEKAFEGF